MTVVLHQNREKYFQWFNLARKKEKKSKLFWIKLSNEKNHFEKQKKLLTL